MEILNKRYALLTNFEVISLLQNVRDEKKKHGLRNLATICYETLQHLEGNSWVKTQTLENITEFRNQVKQYQLTDQECFMMVNDPPTSLLHIQLLIEDSEERLTEEQVTEILEIVKNTLLPQSPEEEDVDEEEEEEEDEGGANEDNS